MGCLGEQTGLFMKNLFLVPSCGLDDIFVIQQFAL